MGLKERVGYAITGIVFLMLALVMGGDRAYAEPLLLGSKGSYDLAGRMAVLQDPSGTTGFDGVLAADRAGRFRPVCGNFSAGYSTSVYWFRFTLIRDKSFPEEGWLRFAPSYLDEVTLYMQHPEKPPGLAASYQVVPIGALIPAIEKPMIHPELVAPVKLGFGQPVTVYVRVFSSSALFIEGSVHTLVDLTNCTEHYLFLQSVYLGIALLIAMMNLLIYFANRDRQFLFFSLYVFSLFLTALTMNGMQPYVLPSVTPLFSWFVSGIIFGVRIIILSLFLLSFFKNETFRQGLFYLRCMIVVGVLEVLSVPFGFYRVMSPLSTYAAFGMIIVTLWMSISMLRNSTPFTRIVFGLILGANALGYVFYFLQNLGLIAFSPVHVKTPQLLSLADFMIICFVLIRRLYKTERQVLENKTVTEQRATVLAEEMTSELHKIYFVLIEQLHKAENKMLHAKKMTSELHENQARIELSLVMEQVANERMLRFMMMMSHEYRTPLAIIQGNLDLLNKKGQTPGCAKRPELLKIQQAIDRLVEIVEVSLEQSRLIDVKSTKEKFIPLADFLNEQVYFARSMWSERSFLLHATLEDEMIYGEKALLNTALFNLFDNAQKYSSLNSGIAITCRIEGKNALITIQNASEGLEEQDVALCFEKFHRGSNSGSKNGNGIGLWLVRQIIQQHNGNVLLQCNDTGVVTAEIRLPVASDKTGC